MGQPRGCCKKICFSLCMVWMLLYIIPALAFVKTIAPIQMAKTKKTAVVIYSMPGCAPCVRARRFLKSHRVPYRYYDITRSARRYREFEALGGNGVPLIKIGQHVLHGYSAIELRQILRRSGYRIK